MEAIAQPLAPQGIWLKARDASWPYLALALFFVASFALRPLIPTAETRYLTVAWEMDIRESYLLMTLNFAPYYHKPPLFFWLIAGAWEVFGVYRAVAMGVVFAIAAMTVLLTTRLAAAMFPDTKGLGVRMPWLLVGSVVFISYSSLIYLDVLVALLVLAFTLSVLAFARRGGVWQPVLAGLFLGLGVLTKGPVMLLYVAWPIVLYPLWRDNERDLSSREFYAGSVTIFLVGLAVVASWLGPLLAKADSDFLYNLLWRQTAGRVSGSLDGAHPQPFWFYLVLLPVVILPWGASPDLWREKPWQEFKQAAAAQSQDFRMLRLLLLWLLAVLASLSVVSGKQPHYVVPGVPLLMIGMGYFMASVSLTRIRNAALAMLALFATGQAIASVSVFDKLDLTPLASFVSANASAEWAYAGEYQGEINFLARLHKPISVIGETDVGQWLDDHPHGYVIVKSPMPVPSAARAVFSQPAMGGSYSVISRNASMRKER